MQSNSVAATFDLLGDRLTLTILRLAFVEHARRFNHWSEKTGAPPAVLTARLAALVDAGVLERDRGEYRLTKLGLDTWEILVCVWSWQREWTAEWSVLPEFVHLDCGHRGPPVLMCRGCGRTVTPHDTDVELDRDALWHITSGRRRSARSTTPARVDARFDEIMEAIGDRWSAAVTGLALAGVRRFSEFRAALHMSPTTLTERLTRLVEAGILHRPETDAREYRLTPRGRALFGVFAFLLAWSNHAHPLNPEPGLRIHHRECGAVLLPALRCRGCDAELGRTDVRFES
ncbi:winged helix-turn-helix transcriptional regulator [Nocardia sp. NBC_01503]|uniref:winged helix-turn-helix transcriptional regulator n=1 Tax=Nocardia sp. NBC_01503 TaxID=2975997 RepID=UPI002E7BD60F|nr:winged helix-turn-helix transcriptional regulator [Nocardia sp. NBC_01503]WTL31942.1 winged helix-turn-helix transcriptional regulator [Nocardia sp. NBC_01503]